MKISNRFSKSGVLLAAVVIAASGLLATDAFAERGGGRGGGGGAAAGRSAGGASGVKSAAPSSVRSSGSAGRNANANANRNANVNQNANANRNVNANQNVNANRNVNANQNVNANRNVNVNNNVNVNRDVNVNTNYHGGYDDDWDNAGAFVAGAVVGGITGAAIASASQPTTVVVAAPAVGTVVTTLPAGCTAISINGISTYQCGTIYYRPSGSTYVVVMP